MVIKAITTFTSVNRTNRMKYRCTCHICEVIIAVNLGSHKYGQQSGLQYGHWWWHVLVTSVGGIMFVCVVKTFLQTLLTRNIKSQGF